MPFAVTHVLIAIIIVGLYRDYVTKHKKYFTLHTLFIAGLAGILPDIDIPINWITSSIGIEFAHRSITHTPFFGLIFLIPGIALWKMRHHKKAAYFFVIAVGILIHISLDFFFITDLEIGGIELFYPLSQQAYGIQLLTRDLAVTYGAGIDAIILLLWLYYEERKHKIKDYI